MSDQTPIDIFLTETSDDEGNAQCVYAVAGKRFLWCDAFGWMRYTGTHWETDTAAAALDRAIVATLKQRRRAAVDKDNEAIIKCSQPSARRVRDCRTLFTSLVTVGVDSFDQSPDEINVGNGVLNLRTGKLTPHDPAQRFTYCIDTPYEPAADYTAWLAFLEDTVQGGDDILEYLQMAVGYSLTGHTSEECLWYIQGPSRSGKGTFTETLLALMGRPLGVETDFATFTAKREGDTQNFDLAPLRPARFIVASESNRYASLNVAKLKALTGGNYIRAAYKHHDLFTYRPQFKVWLVSNEQVNADADDDAVWYRLKVVEFPNGHAGEEDKTLKTKLKAKANLTAVLRWAVEGAMAWYKSPKGLVHPSAVNATTQRNRRDMDFVTAWLDECTQVKPGEWSSNDRTYKSYQTWCKDNGVPLKTLRGLLRSLKLKGYPVDQAKKGEGENKNKTYKGIADLIVDDFQ